MDEYDGNMADSVSKGPDAYPIADLPDEKGNGIFQQADSVVLRVDLHKDIVKRTSNPTDKPYCPYQETHHTILVWCVFSATGGHTFLLGESPEAAR